MALSDQIKDGNELPSPRRRFRPRLLSIRDPIPIYISTPAFSQRHPELSRWLSSKEGTRRNQVQVANEGRVIETEPWLEMDSKHEICRPSWRIVEQLDIAAEGSQPKRELPYKRHITAPLTTVRFLADEEDEAWAMEQKISLARLERCIGALEKEYQYRVTRSCSTNFRKGRVFLELPDEAEILPLKEGVACMGGRHSRVAENIYNYWLMKRRKNGKPLLPELHNQFPWSVLLDHSSDRKRSITRRMKRVRLGRPFEGIAGNKSPVPSPKIPLDEQLRRLASIRQDLEAARALADQVRSRENLKRERDDMFIQEIREEVMPSASNEIRSTIDGWISDRKELNVLVPFPTSNCAEETENGSPSPDADAMKNPGVKNSSDR